MGKEFLLLKTDLKHIQDNAIIFSFEKRTFKGEHSFLSFFSTLLQLPDFYL